MTNAFRETERARRITPSPIRAVFDRARRMQADGIDVARMEIGRPDFDTPEAIKRAAAEALARGQVHYTPSRGLEELRRAIAKKLRAQNGIEADPETDIVVTVGCKEAVFLSVLAYIEAGDEVLIADPCWNAYQESVVFAGGVPRFFPLRADKHFDPDPDDLARLVTSRTRMIVIGTPQNPSGALYSRAALDAIAQLAQKHGLLVIADEIYELLVYDDAVHHSIAALPGMAERTITINGFSKAYAMDGWRLGYAAGSAELIRPLVKLRQYTTSCPNTFAQWGAVTAYREASGTVEPMRAEFDRRRRRLVERLGAMPGVRLVEPRGAFYAFPRFEGLRISSAELAARMLEEAHIACVPGSVFGEGGEGCLRLSYATSYESMDRGLDRVAAMLERMASRGEIG